VPEDRGLRSPRSAVDGLFSVRTIFFQTLHVFFVMHHETREILQARVTRHPTAEWAAQQIVAACGWERDPPRYLIRDRDGRFGIAFDRRVQRLGITQIRTPVRAPRANALAEWSRPTYCQPTLRHRGCDLL
jgi:transposase InsO family protein